MIDNPTRQTALITGASSGIGREFARLFAADRYDLVLLARSEEPLNQLKAELENHHGIEARILLKDLTNPDVPKEVIRELSEAGVRVDVLVNNAGFGGVGEFASTDLKNETDMIEVNVTALTQLTKLFLHGMVDRQSGFILNVASTAGFFPGPQQSIYYATKAFVVSFSQALARELSGTGVRVMAFCPGKTATQFQERAGVSHAALVDATLLMPAEDAARYAYDAMRGNKVIVIPGVKNKLFVFASRFIPREFTALLVDRFQSIVRSKQGKS